MVKKSRGAKMVASKPRSVKGLGAKGVGKSKPTGKMIMTTSVSTTTSNNTNKSDYTKGGYY